MAQGALGAAGVRRIWAGAELQRAAYMQGRGHIARRGSRIACCQHNKAVEVGFKNLVLFVLKT